MSSTVLCAGILLTCALTLSVAQTSCSGRCGTEYYRGFTCQCDYNCLLYGECCKDYESKCTTGNSCKGRCGETFRRGRRCNCDAECVTFKQCCSDYKTHCDAEPALNDAGDQASAFSEGNEDDLMPVVSPKTNPQNDLTDEMYGQILPIDEADGTADPVMITVPESPSGCGPSTADPLDRTSAEPTWRPDATELGTEAFTAFSQTDASSSGGETTRAADSFSTLHPTGGGTPAEADDRTDSGTTVPQPTAAAADPVSTQPPPTSANQVENSPISSSPELQTTAQNANPTASSERSEVTATASDPPLAPVSTEQTQSSSTVLENTQVSTIAPSSPPVSTPIPAAATLIPEDATSGPSFPEDEDPSISVSSTGPPHTDSGLTGTTSNAAQGRATAEPLNATPDPTKPSSSEAASKPQDKPAPTQTEAKPSPKPETKPEVTAQPLATDNPREYQADDSNHTNLCSGRPVGAVTTLSNGTTAVFRGHFFWLLDKTRVPGPAQSITQVWGVPSPIDTAFTRCNCQGKTYILKGAQYWRYENDVLDTGYPKLIESGFDGLRGQITAALSVPQYNRRRESVYFFKRGGFVQKYSYQLGTSQTCSRRVQYAVHVRRVRQTASVLGLAINIRTSWVGFPSTITAAASIPSNREPEGYKYYVFSRSKSYSVRMDGQRPVINAPPANASPQTNIFKCPKSV